MNTDVESIYERAIGKIGYFTEQERKASKENDRIERLENEEYRKRHKKVKK